MRKIVLVVVAMVFGWSSGAGATPYYDAVIADNPVSYWRLGDAGSPAVDDVGGRDLSYSGNPISGQPGAIAGDPDTATRFGGGSVLARNFDPALNASQFSIETWVNIQGDSASSSGGYQFFVASREVFHKGYSLGLKDDPTTDLITWHFQLGQSDGTWWNAVYSQNDPLSEIQDRWHHVVGVFDGGQARLFLNGSQVGTRSFDYAFAPNTTGQFRVGDNYSVPLDGIVDEVGYYNYALSADRVSAHYQIGIGVIPEPSTALLLGLGLAGMAGYRRL